MIVDTPDLHMKFRYNYFSRLRVVLLSRGEIDSLCKNTMLSDFLPQPARLVSTRSGGPLTQITHAVPHCLNHSAAPAEKIPAAAVLRRFYEKPDAHRPR